MALDRTWYNTLVDDDGSGMTGSVWDKADVDALMDAIDATIPVRIVWYPAILHGDTFAALPTSTNDSAYTRVGDCVFFSLYVTGIQLTSAASHFKWAWPASLLPRVGYHDGGTLRIDSGPTGSVFGYWYTSGNPATYGEAHLTATSMPVATYTLHGQGFYYFR
jgi:hypothetical protein